MVAIGGSAGALPPLATVLGALPGGYPIPVVVVSHLPASDRGALAECLASRTRLTVAEAFDKEPLAVGHVHVAPAGYHVLIEADGRLALSVDAKVNWARPSIDVLFESAARAFGPDLLCIVLSGANHDGAAGALLARGRGGLAVAQDPATAECAAMPAAAIARGGIGLVLAPDDIARLLLEAGGCAGPGDQRSPTEIP